MTAAILVEAGGDNRIVIVPGALSSLAPDQVDAFAPQIEAADVLLVQLEIPLETALYALELGRRSRRAHGPEPGACTDPAARDHRRLPDPERDRGAGGRGRGGTTVLTLGDRGARLGDVAVAAFPARAVDTTGAGDAFCAAFAVALAEGASDLDAVRRGCAAGAHMVEHDGVVPGLPTRVELEERLAVRV